MDTIGDLEKAYSIADLVFVGGSLVRHGGQNMLEPASMALPVLMGPHTWNFKADVEILLRAGGAVQVRDEQELEERLGFFVENPAKGRDLGKRAKEVILSMKGAADKTLEELRKHGLLD